MANPGLKIIALALLMLKPAWAAPDVRPAAARLFERAAQVYGGAQTVSLDYQTTSDAPAYPAVERGTVVWAKPDLYAQTFVYAAGSGHFAADADTVYFTRIGGQSGRTPWKSYFGFWNDLPWDVPGHLADLLRGRPLFSSAMAGLQLRVLPARDIEGIWCDGALLDLSKVNGDSIRFWFARKSGALRRESWSVKLPDGGGFAHVQTRYFKVRFNPKLERADFISNAEAQAPLVDPDAQQE